MEQRRGDRKVLVIGGGGREHALAWALTHSPQVGEVFVAPGNAGTSWPAGAACAAARNVPIASDDFSALLEFARQQQIDLTVVGPEQPLTAGIVDMFQAAGQRVFGPTQAASQLEGSKTFAKQFMREHGLPTSDFATFTDYEEARQYLLDKGRSIAPDPYAVVVKADGLAGGKGVIVCANAAEGVTALQSIMVERLFGEAGDRVLIEERLHGTEVSVLALSDGGTAIALPPVRDHKRVFEGDQGPNTGGMGAYTPVTELDSAQLLDIERSILQPVIDGMAARGTPFVGVLYAGLMLTAEGPRVLEFNCRFGDPEAQVLLPLVRDLYSTLEACLDGSLTRLDVETLSAASATVVLGAAGYPGTYATGEPISGLDSLPADVLVFHAGTALHDGHLVTAGGRVLAVSSLGDDLPAALERVYAAIEQISFKGMHFRRDIGRDSRTTGDR